MYFAIYKAANGQFNFVIRGANNETLATSETYVAKGSALAAINVIKKGAAGGDVDDRT